MDSARACLLGWNLVGTWKCEVGTPDTAAGVVFLVANLLFLLWILFVIGSEAPVLHSCSSGQPRSGAVVSRTSFRFANVLLTQRCFDVVVIACLIRYEACVCLLVAFQALLTSSHGILQATLRAPAQHSQVRSMATARIEAILCISCHKPRLFSIPSATGSLQPPPALLQRSLCDTSVTWCHMHANHSTLTLITLYA
jgi:hypothetical protein